MPVPYAPSYEAWSRVFEERPITAGTIAVGHSCGAGFLVRWFATHPTVWVELRGRGHFADGPGQRLSEILPMVGLPTNVSVIAPRQ